MKRVVLGVFVGLVLLLGFSPIASAGVDDFRFTNYEVDYYLGADSEARSTLKTVERLTAEFPAYDQNHGIERAIPKRYDGHTTGLRLASVTDSSGKLLHYTTYESGDNLVVRIGDKETYVHGVQTYVLTYEQRDVTKTYSDTQRNEFYWDTNGTQWAQAFDRVIARVHVSKPLLPTLTDNLACYSGREGSTQQCEIQRSGGTVTAQVVNLDKHENMTIALGFTLGTFRSYEPSFWDRLFTVWIAVLIVSSLLGLIVLFWLSYMYTRASNRDKDLNPIAPEYIPPKDTSVLVAAKIGSGTRAETTAQLIDLAVRHFITITQTKEKTIWRQAEYDLEIVKPIAVLTTDEKTFIKTLFGSDKVGTKLETKSLKNNYTLSSSLYKNSQTLLQSIKSGMGLREKDPAASRPFTRIGTVLLIVGVVIVSPVVLIAAIVALVCGWQLKPLTDKGLALRRYLAGLKNYIELAEKDRIAALQSPEAVAKTGVSIDGGNDKKLIKLYERTLPYAVLFGQEKEWNKQLAVHYENTNSAPSWYVGHGAFNAAVFTSAMNDFGSSMNSYGASTSSSSGGSSGGGSSGGGGGGGGGGGW